MYSNPSAKPINSFPSGTKVKVSCLCAGAGARCRMCAMGLTPGTDVEVVDGGPGRCRLRVRGTDVVLGCQLAAKILAEAR